MPVSRYLLVSICLALGACYQVQVSGPVAGASVVISPIAADGEAVSATSWTREQVDAAFGAEAVADYPDFLQLALLGLVTPDKSTFRDDDY